MAVTNLAPMPVSLNPAIIANIVTNGDLSQLDNTQRVQYYNFRCQQAGLDPSAKPFDLLRLNGKLVLYANATCTQQLCAVHKLTTTVVAREKMDDAYVVVVRVSAPDGRATENMGAVPIAGLKGEAFANALMKAQTKAIRRTVLAHCGLGMLDETEVVTIPGAERVDTQTGEVRTLAPVTVRVDPRPDTSNVDMAVAEQYVSRVADILASDHTPEDKASRLLTIHDELNPHQELYVVVRDRLVADKIISSTKWKAGLELGRKVRGEQSP